ncbi:transcriptional regulator [Micromonospora sp. ATCC 39149]|uniref:TetR/AcrR family transcriptional regulator n=1 Tax=Micromonospora carbonacea TaxID=47853 RepID=A0A7D6CC16_9ACTN|nr:TetR family transcriptional regulator [Micromonospora sp. ATCC 39149]EEP72917.1 transcriptional regulator [Micromonospora sp. ATCC 39149]QLJ98985.1 TetR/AcrR family transcriptional regulator [Micromonospora carbonacea]
MTAIATREQIVRAADRLFYERGFEHTSFADIAAAVGLSRGNFYYHFKSKAAILDAVIAARLDERRGWLARWEAEEPDPAARILRFIEIVHVNRADIQAHGCPLGTMTTELAKLEHTMLMQAGELLTLFRDWLTEQFRLLGHAERSEDLAMHVLTFSQGVAVLANLYRDENYIRREVDQMRAWLHALQPTT